MVLYVHNMRKPSPVGPMKPTSMKPSSGAGIPMLPPLPSGDGVVGLDKRGAAGVTRIHKKVKKKDTETSALILDLSAFIARRQASRDHRAPA